MMKHSICDSWEFTKTWSEDFAHGEGTATAVRLPHNPSELNIHYGDSDAYQMVCGYRRLLHIDTALAGKRLFLQFDGAGHIATIYVNGQEVDQHAGGYTAFRVEITEFVTPGEDALIAVQLDTSENTALPPFGSNLRFLTYGGLYREVWLDVREQCYIENIFVHSPNDKTVHVEVDSIGAGMCQLEILDADGAIVSTKEGHTPLDLPLENAHLWSVDDPYRYSLRCTLLGKGRQKMDVQEVKFGVRTVEFRKNAFYLNGKKTFLRGLNRHQCYPYMGYAAPERLQREDARILKQELGCTAVRTSHYPQSQYFLDECDRLGLLVFAEIPGWQSIGNDGWKKRLCNATQEMILQNRNHPSIVLWGVRVSDSKDDDALYLRTNALAHELDPSRPTSGVRSITKSHQKEDVYAYNDYSFTGSGPSIRPKKEVMRNVLRPLLISEHTGAMFPTKSCDSWAHRQEQAMRHAEVLNDAAAFGEHCGCFGESMTDFPTHREFGSGDRMNYHGVMDFFRNPKLAASLYASQQDDAPVLSVSSSMNKGDYPGGQIGDVSVFTNADTVALYKNNVFVTNLERLPWHGLPHPPMIMNDVVGTMLEAVEALPPKKAKALHDLLLMVHKSGFDHLTYRERSKIRRTLFRHRVRYGEFLHLCKKHLDSQGSEPTVWSFQASKHGEITSSVVISTSNDLRLEVSVSGTNLQECQSYDVSAVRIRITDEFGNLAPYAQIPVQFQLEGCCELVGPSIVTAEGGMCGTYVRTTGRVGSAKLTISTSQTEPVTIDFTVE